MTDLSHWDLAINFTGRETAYLLMGVDPSKPDTNTRSSRHTLERVKAAYDGAIERAKFEGYVEPCFQFECPSDVDQLMPDCAVLRSVALWERLDAFREHGDSTTFTDWLDNADLEFERQKFSRREISRWLKENNLKSDYQFDVEQPATAGPHAKTTAEKPLSNRERGTLLTIIAALCSEAKIPYEKPAKAAGMIQSTAAKLGVSIGETTIENHLKKIPDALESRMK